VVGPVHRFDLDELPVAVAGAGAAWEQAALERALATVRSHIEQRAHAGKQAVRDIMAAHLELLDDPELLSAARDAIRAGKSAGYAWRGSLRANAAALEATGDARLAERAADLADLERQVLRELAGTGAQRIEIVSGAILVAHDLTPSQLIDIDTSRLGGIALEAGGATSHVAILAATLGVPMLVNAGTQLGAVRSGDVIVLDAESGQVMATPTGAELEKARARLAQQNEQKARELAAELRQEGRPTVPGTIADELATNPFMRCGEPAVAEAAARHAGRTLGSPVDVFAEIREWKNKF